MKSFAMVAAALLLPGIALATGSSQSAPSASLYQLDTAFTDQDGTPFRLRGLEGHPVIISMFYGSCHQACPLLIHDIKRVEKSLSPSARKQLRVVLVTFDPKHDTTESLRQLRAAHGVDPDRWTFLRTDPDTVRTLATLLGISYRVGANGVIHHTSVLTLLDERGLMVDRQEGTGLPVDGLAAHVERVAGRTTR